VNGYYDLQSVIFIDKITLKIVSVIDGHYSMPLFCYCY
jgi:hypothetical protein